MTVPTESRIAEHVVARPAAALASFVHSYTGYHFAGFAPGLHAGLPSRHLTFIVSFDDPVDCIVVPDPTQRPDRFGALLGGLHTNPAVIRHDGTEHGVQLALTPLGARALFGCPAAAVASSVVHLDTVFGPHARELQDRLPAAAGWPARFAILDDVLGAAVRDHRAPRAEVGAAWSLLASSRGTIEIGEIAAEVGWSRRHLAQQFRQEYGVGPKAMARVMRFESAKRLLTLPTAPSLAAIAAHCGYADQAHFGREWKELSGASPTAWLAGDQLVLPSAPIDPAVPIGS